MSNVYLVADENLLLSAYRTVMGGKKKDPTELVAEYERHFSSVVAPSSNQRHVFERFSMADSNVRVVLRSSTASV